MPCPACGRPMTPGKQFCSACGAPSTPPLVTFLDPLLVGRQVHIYDGRITKLTSAVAQIIPDPYRPGVITIVTQSGSRYTGCIGQAAPIAPIPPPESPSATQVLPTIPAGYQQPESVPIEPKKKKHKKGKPSQLPMTLGLVGGGLMFIGCFLPLIQGPLGISLSYVTGGRGDGMVVLVLSLVTVGFSLARFYMPLFATGLITAGLLVRVAVLMSQVGIDTDNPLARKIASAFSLSVGWGVIMVGAIVALVAACVPRSIPKK